MTKRRALYLAVALAAAALVAIAFNEAGNASARAELEPACGCARATVDRTLTQSGELFYELFEDDAGEVRSFMRGEVSGLCDELEGELVIGRWNLFRSWSPTPHPDRADRVRQALERARPRCPETYAGFFQLMGDDREGAAELREDLFAGMEPSEQTPLPIPTWEWPALIDRSMCLDEERSARASGR